MCVTVSIGLDWIFFCFFFFVYLPATARITFISHIKTQRNNNWFLIRTLCDFTSYTLSKCHSKYEKLVFNYSFSWFFFRRNCFLFLIRSSAMVDGCRRKTFSFNTIQPNGFCEGKKVRMKTCWNSFNLRERIVVGCTWNQVNVDNNGAEKKQELTCIELIRNHCQFTCSA